MQPDPVLDSEAIPESKPEPVADTSASTIDEAIANFHAGIQTPVPEAEPAESTYRSKSITPSNDERPRVHDTDDQEEGTTMDEIDLQ